MLKNVERGNFKVYEQKCKIKDLMLTPKGECALTVILPRTFLDVYDDIKGSELKLKLCRYRRKRSLNANSYYWTILSDMAEINRISLNRQHNLLLRRYGQLEKIAGNIVVVDIPELEGNEELVDESETVHLKPTSRIKHSKNGTEYRTYIMLRGSHTYDSREMSRLLEGTISEAKAMGINTLTPEELSLLEDSG